MTPTNDRTRPALGRSGSATGNPTPGGWEARRSAHSDSGYAHHGQIRCYTWRRSTLGAVQRWDAYCACGWRTENQPDWACAYWRLFDHQDRKRPGWFVLPGLPVTVRSTRDAINETPLQRAHRPNGARA